MDEQRTLVILIQAVKALISLLSKYIINELFFVKRFVVFPFEIAKGNVKLKPMSPLRPLIASPNFT